MPEDGPAQSFKFKIAGLSEGPHLPYALVFAKAQQKPRTKGQPRLKRSVGQRALYKQAKPAGDKVLAAAGHEDRLPNG